MKLIGIIGGTSWESSAEYYRLLNQGAKERLGGLHSARLLMYSFDFAEIEVEMKAGHWDTVGDMMVEAARRLEKGGAEFLVIATNTLHVTVPRIEAEIHLPILHIADPTGREARRFGLTKVGLLGTRFTMEKDFMKNRLKERFGLEVIVPDEKDRAEVNRVIFDELCRGVVKDESKARFLDVVSRLESAGAGGIVLGCTEIPMLLRRDDLSLPLLDTTYLHARAALDFALEGA